MSEKVTYFPESPQLAWKRGSEFNLKAIVESLRKIGYPEVAKELETFPLCPYMPEGINPDGSISS